MSAKASGAGSPTAGTADVITKVLVVDDEPAMVGVIGAILGQAGHRMIPAYDGTEALRRFKDEDPDLVLLDLAMPGLDGAVVCREIRAVSDVPIIVISGESNLAVTVELLDAGADDYIRKPFRGEELLARSRAVLRRTRRSPGRGSWAVDRNRHEVRWQDQALSLTVIEFRLLSRLIARIGEVVETRDLLAYAWPGVTDPDPVWLKPHLARLRTKLAHRGAPVPRATRGVGYRLEDHEPVDAGEAPQPGDHDVRAGVDAIRDRLDAEVITEL
jgi:DNA-binding response OmpR family regulator